MRKIRSNPGTNQTFPSYLLTASEPMKLADFLLPFAQQIHVPSHLTTWQPGITPLSTTPVVISVMAGYLTTIFGIQYVLRDSKPYVLNTWFRAHNLVLSVGSGLLLALMVEEIAPIVQVHGLRYAICDPGAWTPVRNASA